MTYLTLNADIFGGSVTYVNKNVLNMNIYQNRVRLTIMIKSEDVFEYTFSAVFLFLRGWTRQEDLVV